MRQHRVMDPTGHSTIPVDMADKTSLAEAEQRFRELTGRGFTAAKEAPDGKHDVIHEFDPDANLLFFPALQSG